MYCNYSKDKFGNELTFIIPSWFSEEKQANISLKYSDLIGENNAELLCKQFLCNSEITYNKLLEEGWKPQEARQVLPNALKTEINMCGYLKDWKHFFKLRTAPNAHPDMVVLAKQLEQLFNEQNLWKNSTY